MRVIFINRFFYPDESATSQMLSDLAFELTQCGFDIYVITSRLSYTSENSELPDTENVNGVKVHRIYSTGFGRGNLIGRCLDYLSFYVFSVIKLWQLARANDIIIAKTDPPLLSIFAASVSWARRCKHINWLQDIYPEVAQKLNVGGIAMRGIYYLLRILRNRSLRSADINIVPGKGMQQYLVSEGIEENRTYVIPNWADGQGIYPISHESNPLRQRWGLRNKFVVGYSGNFGRAHNLLIILQAAKKLSQMDTGKDIAFLLIGGGAQLADVEHVIEQCQLDNIMLKPCQPRNILAESLSIPDLHLVSLVDSLEGFIVPSKFYGIAAAGRMTCFIGSDTGEIASILRLHKIGLTISDGDTDGLVSTIIKLKADQTLCEQTGTRARQIFEAHYNKPIATRKWEILLGNVGNG